jgi:hypothetical protein
MTIASLNSRSSPAAARTSTPHHRNRPSALNYLPGVALAAAVPCAGSDCSTRASARPLVAPSGSSCSRSGRSSASASVVSRSRWRQAVPPLRSGEMQPFVSPPPHAHAARQSDTRRRTRHNRGIIPRPTETASSPPPQPRKCPLLLAPHRAIATRVRSNPGKIRRFGSAATPR